MKLNNFSFDTQECKVKIAFNNLANNSILNQDPNFYVDYMADNDEWTVTNIQITEYNMSSYTFNKDSKLTNI